MVVHRLSASGAPLSGGLDLGSACVLQEFAPNGGDTAQVADFDLTTVLNELSVGLDAAMADVTVMALLHMATIRNVDGEFPQARIYAVSFYLDSDGFVQAPNLDENNLETGNNNSPFGGLTDYGDGGGATPIAATSTGTDQIITVTMTGDSGGFPGATGKLCLEVAHNGIPSS